jgi:4a-hydroxytetrahydrobiopterin dehydratase
MTDDQIAASRFHDVDGVHDWRVVSDGAVVHYPTDSFAASARLVRAVGELDELADHPPAVDVRARGVTFRLVTATAEFMGLTRRDAEVARRISSVAGKLGLTADTAAVQSVLIIPGSSSVADVVPFWQAVLGYDRRADSPEADLVDPQDRNPAFWFEQMDELRQDGGGTIHVAVWVPSEVAEGRVAAALAAGGRLVRDAFAPAWWTLADAAGNEVDVATIQYRD